MASNIATSSIGHSKDHWTARRILTWASGLVYVGALTVTGIYMLVNGPAIRAAANSYTAEQIQQENTAFCQRLGIPRGTEAFATCASVLADVRKRHEDRVTRDLVGFI